MIRARECERAGCSAAAVVRVRGAWYCAPDAEALPPDGWEQLNLLDELASLVDEQLSQTSA